MAIASPINLDKVSSGIKSLNTGMGQLKKSADNIKTVSLNKTRIKRESIARNRMLGTMREEAVRRKDQESIIEASGISGAFKRSGKVIGDSTKGFLGRLLDFASSLLLGWLLYNLPTIMTAIEELITRIRTLYGILTEFMGNIRNTFINFGQLLSAVYQDITQFDFTDQSKRVQNAMDDLSANMDSMHDEFMKGFELLTTPLGQGPGEKEVPPLNTDYTQDAPTTGGGSGGGDVSGYGTKEQQALLKTIRFAEGTAGSTGYSMFFGDKYGKSKYGDLTKLSANEVEKLVTKFLKDPQSKFGNGQSSAAVGAYQIINITAKAKALGMDMNRKFDQSFQDEMALRLAAARGVTSEVLKKEGLSESVIKKLSPEWASFPGNNYNQPTKRSQDLKSTYQASLSSPTKSTTGNIPTAQAPTKPSTNFASVSGTSGDSMGNKPLSVPYSPFKPGSGAQITSGKGYRWGRLHKGYDLAARSGTPLYAYFPGKVTHIGIDGTASSAGYGNWVVWKDDIYGAYHFFGHMRDRPSVGVGQVINQGTLMGYVGDTGVSYGPHLHWEISSTAPASNGQFTSLEDPGAWLKQHPLKPIKASQINAIDSPNSSPISTLPAQVSPPKPPGQNVPSVAQDRKGQQIVIADNPQQPQPQQVSSGGGRSQPQMIPFEDSLNSLIKNQILLELAYT